MDGYWRTLLIPKTEEPTADPSQYRPIACLNIAYKLFTSYVTWLVTDHVNCNELLAPEQKAIKQGREGCLEALLLDAAITCDAETRHETLCMAWIDFRKAFDSIPHKWLRKVLRAIGRPAP